MIASAKEAGVEVFLVPGTDLSTSKKAVELASSFEEVYSAVGIHPHHVFSLLEKENGEVEKELGEVKKLAVQKKVVAIGEIGLDKHIYKKTKYKDYKINQRFLELQKLVLKEQIKIALEFEKAVVFHNREAKDEFLKLLSEVWDHKLSRKAVFHCCEPEEELLEFAKEKKIFLGFDGDLTYNPKKQVFFKKIPLELIVFETDSPFLTPEPVRQRKPFPNEPKNLVYTIQFAQELTGRDCKELTTIGRTNGEKLFFAK